MSRVHPSDEAYTTFAQGQASSTPPLSSIDKKINRFISRIGDRPVELVHGQILRNFGMYPPEFWNRAQGLSSHPDTSPKVRASTTDEASTPGPMAGGAKTLGKTQFSHGINW